MTAALFLVSALKCKRELQGGESVPDPSSTLSMHGPTPCRGGTTRRLASAVGVGGRCRAGIGPGRRCQCAKRQSARRETSRSTVGPANKLCPVDRPHSSSHRPWSVAEERIPATQISEFVATSDGCAMDGTRARLRGAQASSSSERQSSVAATCSCYPNCKPDGRRVGHLPRTIKLRRAHSALTRLTKSARRYRSFNILQRS